MLALKTIASLWHVERRNRNEEEIAERTGKLYDKFVGFIGESGVRWRSPYPSPDQL
jgi:DNA anti-recombination protein RmuC